MHRPLLGRAGGVLLDDARQLTERRHPRARIAEHARERAVRLGQRVRAREAAVELLHREQGLEVRGDDLQRALVAADGAARIVERA